MLYKKRLIVLNGMAGGAEGVLKMQASDKTYCTVNFSREATAADTKIVVEADGQGFVVSPAAETFELPQRPLEKVCCLVLFDNRPVFYGSNAFDKKTCLMLAEKYDKSQIRSNSSINSTSTATDSDKPPLPSPADLADEASESEKPTDSADLADEPLQEKGTSDDAEQDENIPGETGSPATKRKEKPFADEQTSNAFAEPNKTKAQKAERAVSKKSKENSPPVSATKNAVDEKKRQCETTSTASARGNAFVLDKDVEYSGEDYYHAVKPQLDEMFVCYPEFPLLAELIETSTWIKVEADGDFYVVGVVFDGNGNAQKIAYGIHGNAGLMPPEEVRDVCVWQAIDGEGDGFWIIYQDAKTGKCV